MRGVVEARDATEDGPRAEALEGGGARSVQGGVGENLHDNLDAIAAQRGDAEAFEEEEECEAAVAGNATHDCLLDTGIMQIGSDKPLCAGLHDMPNFTENQLSRVVLEPGRGGDAAVLVEIQPVRMLLETGLGGLGGRDTSLKRSGMDRHSYGEGAFEQGERTNREASEAFPTLLNEGRLLSETSEIDRRRSATSGGPLGGDLQHGSATHGGDGLVDEVNAGGGERCSPSQPSCRPRWMRTCPMPSTKTRLPAIVNAPLIPTGKRHVRASYAACAAIGFPRLARLPHGPHLNATSVK